MIKSLSLAIADRPVGKERSVTPQAGVQHLLFAGNVKERLLLAGETRFRQVFRGSATAHCHVYIGDACAIARHAGVRQLRIESDPFARAFYERCGAVRVGEVASASIPGRVLPLLTLGVS